MPTITVTTREGEQRVLDADEGASVMEVIRDNGIDELEATCGGCCCCATCHVYVDASQAATLPDISEDEQLLLEGSEHYRPGVSRLSCQLKGVSDFNGLKVAIAPEG